MTIGFHRPRRLRVLLPSLAAALVLAACTGGAGAGGHNPSPPGALRTDAPARPAGAVSVYPTAGSKLASPQTQIALRGVAPSDIGTVSVSGSQSGPHPGTMRPDSDGQGASFYPDQPFTPGEQVTVSTDLDIVGGQSGKYTFTVAQPDPSAFGPTLHNEVDDPSQQQSFHSAPSLNPPKFTITHGSIDSGDGDIFIGPRSGPGQDGPMIVDAAGNLVWFKSLPAGVTPSDVRVQTYQGQPVLTWWQGAVTGTGEGLGEDVIYNDSYQQIATVKGADGYQADLHDFTLTAHNTALVTAYEPVRWDLSSIGGPAAGVALDAIMQEIDIATGNVLLEWHALDHVPVADSYEDISQVGKKGKPAYYDFFHINALDMDANGNLLISGRATHTVYDVDPVTGDILWQLGGKHSSFTGSGTTFSSQHDAKWAGPDLITLFNNAAGVGQATAKKSNGMLIRLDPAARTATLVQSYASSDVPLANSQGDTQPLPGGDVFVGWGSQWWMSQFSPDGTLVYEAKLPTKDSSYRAYRFPWSGHPLDKPAVAASGSTVYASWNGATQVASWRVLTGPSAAKVSTVSTAPRNGFETAIPVSSLGAYVQVQALDQAGNVLGTSAATRVS